MQRGFPHAPTLSICSQTVCPPPCFNRLTINLPKNSPSICVLDYINFLKTWWLQFSPFSLIGAAFHFYWTIHINIKDNHICKMKFPLLTPSDSPLTAQFSLCSLSTNIISLLLFPNPIPSQKHLYQGFQSRLNVVGGNRKRLVLLPGLGIFVPGKRKAPVLSLGNHC